MRIIDEQKRYRVHSVQSTASTLLDALRFSKLDTEFKKAESNFKIAIMVDMWLTGFDVPFLDTIYIDKPIQRHNLIQTISRVNRKFANKKKGPVVDYIGIKKQMNLALARYSKTDGGNIGEVEASIAGKTQTQKAKFFNLDAIIAVGYRVKFLRGNNIQAC